MKALNTILTGLILSAVSFAQATDAPLRFKAEFSLDKGESIRASRLYEGGNKLLIVGTKNLQIWDVANPRLLAIRPHEIVPVSSFRETAYKVSPDGQRIIVVDETGAGRRKEGNSKATAVVYSGETGKRITALQRPEFAVRHTAWSENGDVLVSFSGLEFQNTTEVAFWDGRDLSFRSSIIVKGYTWHYFSRDGKRIFIGSGGQAKVLGLAAGPRKGDVVRVYNSATGALERELTTSGPKFNVEPVYTMVSPDERYLVAALDNEKIFVWDLDAAENTPKYEIVPEGTEKDLSLMDFIGNGEFLYVAQKRAQRFYDLATGQPGSGVPGMLDLKYAPDKVIFTPDRKHAVLQFCSGAEVMDLTSRRRLYEFKLDCDGHYTGPPLVAENSIGPDYLDSDDIVAIDNSGKLLLEFRGTAGRVRKLETGEILQSLPPVQRDSWSIEGDLVVAFLAKRESDHDMENRLKSIFLCKNLTPAPFNRLTA